MKLSETFTYTGVTVEAVYDLITNETFRAESSKQQGALEQDVTVDGSSVLITRTMPADVPDFVKKLTGETVKVKQTENWSDPGDGTRVADVKVSIIGQPAEMLGTATLAPHGDGTLFTVEGNVKVSIPLLGRKMEPVIHKAIVSSLRDEVDYGLTQL